MANRWEVGGRLRKGTTGVKDGKSLDRLGKGENIDGTEEGVGNRGTYDGVRMWHSPDEKRQSKTERRLPHHLYISLKPIKLWNWIHGCGEREREREGKSALEIRTKTARAWKEKCGGEWRNTSLSLWHLPSEWHQLNGAKQPNSDVESKVEKERERDRRKSKSEKAEERQRNRKEMNDSKEEKSDRMGRRVPVRHCFTSHCTEQENLSYASAFHIAFTIYVPGRIMQLDGSVEKTPINLILFSIFFFSSLSFSFSAPVILSVCVLWHSSAPVYFLTSYVKVFSSRPLSHVYCILLSL